MSAMSKKTTAEAIDEVADAVRDVLTSSDIADSNLENANVADMLYSIACKANSIAIAITPVAVPGHDAAGGTVGSLTEAVMGVTAGLFKIADAISDLASAIRERGE